MINTNKNAKDQEGRIPNEIRDAIARSQAHKEVWARLTEDWDEFRLSWSWGDNYACVTVYEITGYEIIKGKQDKPMFTRKGWKRLPDFVECHEEAEVYLHGLIWKSGEWKLDTPEPLSFDDRDELERHWKLVGHVYERAFELM